MKLTKHLFTACFLLYAVSSSAQLYIHPNQPGNMGGNTTGVGIGSRVVTTTYYGQVNGAGLGTIYAYDKPTGESFTTHAFSGYPSDASYPYYTSPFTASDQNIYGQGTYGGSANLGAVYKQVIGCTYSILYNFGTATGDTTGAANYPTYANLNELSDGKLYTLFTYGGATATGQLLSMNKDGTGVTVLHTFTVNTIIPRTAASILNTTAEVTAAFGVYNPASLLEGTYPCGFVVEGPDGKVYGTTKLGGYFNQGTVWRMNKNGTGYEIIRDFNATALNAYYKDPSGATIPGINYGEAQPVGNVAIGSDNKVYYTSYYGGAGNIGVLARVDTNGANRATLYSFNAGSGYYPWRGPLIIENGAAKRIYGTCSDEGVGYGTVWRINEDGTGFTVMKAFGTNFGAEGYKPMTSLAFDGTKLWGTCALGGPSGRIGTLYSIDTSGANFTMVHGFANATGLPPDSCSTGGNAAVYAWYPSAERVTFSNMGINCSPPCGIPTGVNFEYFNAGRLNASAAQLQWKTARETNTTGFEIERSADGKKFSKIGFSPSAVKDQSGQFGHEYSFMDNAPFGTLNFYRIKELDRDGKHTYSVIRSVNFAAHTSVNIYPNPVRNGMVNIAGLTGNESINIYNITGQHIRTTKANNPLLQLDINDLTEGIYEIKIMQQDGQASSYKIIKSR